MSSSDRGLSVCGEGCVCACVYGGVIIPETP